MCLKERHCGLHDRTVGVYIFRGRGGGGVCLVGCRCRWEDGLGGLYTLERDSLED